MENGIINQEKKHGPRYTNNGSNTSAIPPLIQRDDEDYKAHDDVDFLTHGSSYDHDSDCDCYNLD